MKEDGGQGRCDKFHVYCFVDYVLCNFNLKSIFMIFKRMETNGLCDDEEKPWKKEKKTEKAVCSSSVTIVLGDWGKAFRKTNKLTEVPCRGDVVNWLSLWEQYSSEKMDKIMQHGLLK